VPDCEWASELLKMNRSRIKRLVGAITGHCGLNSHLAKMGIASDPKCTCSLGEETGYHIICECPKFSLLGLRFLGGHVIRSLDVLKLGLLVLDKFLVSTGRFERFT